MSNDPLPKEKQVVERYALTDTSTDRFMVYMTLEQAQWATGFVIKTTNPLPANAPSWSGSETMRVAMFNR